MPRIDSGDGGVLPPRAPAPAAAGVEPNRYAEPAALPQLAGVRRRPLERGVTASLVDETGVVGWGAERNDFADAPESTGDTRCCACGEAAPTAGDREVEGTDSEA
jgi:hypothetical protein